MTEDTTTTTEEPVEAPTSEPRTFTQEEVNRIAAENKRALREENDALKAKLADLEPKASKLDELEAERMTELERIQKERDEAAAQLAELQAQAEATKALEAKKDAALAAAKELGYPSAERALQLAKFIDGEDFSESAKALFAEFKPIDRPLPSAVHDVLHDTPEDDPLRKAFMGA